MYWAETIGCHLHLLFIDMMIILTLMNKMTTDFRKKRWPFCWSNNRQSLKIRIWSDKSKSSHFLRFILFGFMAVMMMMMIMMVNCHDHMAVVISFAYLCKCSTVLERCWMISRYTQAFSCIMMGSGSHSGFLSYCNGNSGGKTIQILLQQRHWSLSFN